MTTNVAAIITLDATRRKGTFQITTASGTRYWVEVWKGPAGGVRVASDGVLKRIESGTVGGCGCHNDGPAIRVGETMCLVEQIPLERRGHIVKSTPVATIEAVTDGLIDTFLCPSCRVGFQEGDAPCHFCRRPPGYVTHRVN